MKALLVVFALCLLGAAQAEENDNGIIYDANTEQDSSVLVDNETQDSEENDNQESEVQQLDTDEENSEFDSEESFAAEAESDSEETSNDVAENDNSVQGDITQDSEQAPEQSSESVVDESSFASSESSSTVSSVDDTGANAGSSASPSEDAQDSAETVFAELAEHEDFHSKFSTPETILLEVATFIPPPPVRAQLRIQSLSSNVGEPEYHSGYDEGFRFAAQAMEKAKKHKKSMNSLKLKKNKKAKKNGTKKHTKKNKKAKHGKGKGKGKGRKLRRARRFAPRRGYYRRGATTHAFAPRFGPAYHRSPYYQYSAVPPPPMMPTNLPPPPYIPPSMGESSGSGSE